MSTEQNVVFLNGTSMQQQEVFRCY